jgi:hypothetical protein
LSALDGDCYQVGPDAPKVPSNHSTKKKELCKILPMKPIKTKKVMKPSKEGMVFFTGGNWMDFQILVLFFQFFSSLRKRVRRWSAEHAVCAERENPLIGMILSRARSASRGTSPGPTTIAQSAVRVSILRVGRLVYPIVNCLCV